MSNLSVAILVGTLAAVILIQLMKWIGSWADRKYEQLERLEKARNQSVD